MSLAVVSAVSTGLFGASLLLLISTAIFYRKIRSYRPIVPYDTSVPVIIPNLYSQNGKNHFQPSILITAQKKEKNTTVNEKPAESSSKANEPAEGKKEPSYKTLSLTNRMHVVKVNNTSGGSDDKSR